VDLRITVDDRTNSLIVAGSQNDLDTIGALIRRLEAADVQQRMFEVYKLRNASAADVATNVQTLMTNALNATNTAGFNTGYAQLIRNVQLVPEPVSNTVLISATPQYFAEIKRIIERIDAQPPQVLIQVTIAEVQLNNAEEFGVQFGLQSPVIFGRSTVNNTPGTPGFNFLTTNTALPNANTFQQGNVGFQGINDLGVGRIGTQSVGGLVLSAQSQSFNLLIRALNAQGRVNILSRPQVQVTDNQTGFVQVGQDFPIPGQISQGTVNTLQSIDYRPTGVTMRVTPRVNPDGKVLMRVEPQISAPASTPIAVGGGTSAFPFNVQTVQTTVLAGNGETIVLGGLITDQDTRTENGIPFFKNIPYVGALFRYRTHTVARREILIIMTPHIIFSEADNARVLAEEARRMEWCLPDLARVHGHGMEVIGPAMTGATPTPVPGFVNPGGPIPGGYQFGPPGFPANDWVPPAGGTPPGPVFVPGPGGAPRPGPGGAPLPGPQPLPLPGAPDGTGAAPLPAFQPAAFPAAAAPAFQPGPYTQVGTIAPAAAAAAPAPARGPGYVMTPPPPPAPPAPPPPTPVPGRGFALTPAPTPPAPTPPAAAPTTPTRPATEGRPWSVYR
jgi:general secretion pathway protein D